MGKFFDEIPDSLLEWISKQHMFWVASAPLNPHGHINVSPKGTADSFHIVNSKQVWYEDLSGSGVETISHLRENGRITIMFSAFEGPPRIVRLFGVGTVHEYGSPEYNKLIPAGTRKPGSRAVIVVDVYQVGTSCGYAVPFYTFVRHRTQLLQFFDKIETGDRDRLSATCDNNDRQKSDDYDYHHLIPSCQRDVYTSKGASSPPSLRAYWFLKNTFSLDGLPALSTAPDAILSTTPQSRFDRESPQRTMSQNMASADESRNSIFGNRSSFASGFVLGAVAVLAVSRVLVKLQH